MSGRSKGNSWVEGLITAVSIGGFLIILGAVFGLTPGIPQKTGGFFGDLTFVPLPLDSGSLSLLAPANPSQHLDFFGAVFNFMLGIGILQVVILALRLWVRSPIRRIADSVGDLVFWFGAAVVANVFLFLGTLDGWFQFWAALLVIIGVSLIARFFVYLATKRLA